MIVDAIPKKRMRKTENCFLCRFLIEDGAKANYAAISANVALAGIEGGHDKYDLYLRYVKEDTNM